MRVRRVVQRRGTTEGSKGKPKWGGGWLSSRKIVQECRDRCSVKQCDVLERIIEKEYIYVSAIRAADFQKWVVVVLAIVMLAWPRFFMYLRCLIRPPWMYNVQPGRGFRDPTMNAVPEVEGSACLPEHFFGVCVREVLVTFRNDCEGLIVRRVVVFWLNKATGIPSFQYRRKVAIGTDFLYQGHRAWDSPQEVLFRSVQSNISAHQLL